MKLFKNLIGFTLLILQINIYAYGYESSYGNKYQYDLSNPLDKMKYEVDLKAQMRDEMNINPSRDLDRGLGQYGGGIYD